MLQRVLRDYGFRICSLAAVQHDDTTHWDYTLETCDAKVMAQQHCMPGSLRALTSSAALSLRNVTCASAPPRENKYHP